MRHDLRRACWPMMIALALWSCEGGGVVPIDSGGIVDATTPTDSDPGTSDGQVTLTDATTSDTPPGVSEVFTPPGVSEVFTPTEVVSPADTVEGCPGCFGSPCEEHLDCHSGWCTQGADGLQCTKLCDEDCPAGYSCRQVTQPAGDPVFLCLYDHVHFCRPCAESVECYPPLVEASTARCLELTPNDGAFCATPCDVDADCPAGAACNDVEVAGAPTGLCQPTSLTCECSSLATLVEATTECSVTNEAGTCLGERMCGEEGLTDCSAKTPTAELCDGL
ncbi:MAG: hypothetical protein QF464_09880, partial [Myxococcota bacterium]|nr:hypothetical protein [Myxococcota bacterium]